MRESKQRRNRKVVFVVMLVLAAASLSTFIPVERADARRESETEIWVEVGSAAACGASSGNFEAFYKGRTIQVAYAHDKLRMYDGRKTRIAASESLALLCPLSHDGEPNQLTSKRVLIEGRWTSKTTFEMWEIHYNLPSR